MNTGSSIKCPPSIATDFDRAIPPAFDVLFRRGNEQLMTHPAYVGALQSDFAGYGHYCGPIDGVFSDQVGAAIARLQKNYSMRVTGTLTIRLRRALHLP